MSHFDMERIELKSFLWPGIIAFILEDLEKKIANVLIARAFQDQGCILTQAGPPGPPGHLATVALAAPAEAPQAAAEVLQAAAALLGRTPPQLAV